METSANTKLIGAFILSVLVGLFGFVYWLSRSGEGRNQAEYAVHFDGSVSGLTVGAAVNFNGIRVGNVKKLSLNPTDPRSVIALIAVEGGTPVRQDTKVTLEFQGVTGYSVISMAGGSYTAALLPSESGKPAIIYAEPSAVADIMATARTVLGKLDSAMSGISETLKAVDNAKIKSTVDNIELFSSSLGRNADSIDKLMKDAGEAAKNLNATVARIEKFAAALDPAQGGGILSDFSETAKSIKLLAEKLDKRTAELTGGIGTFTSKTTRDIEGLLAEGKRALSQVEKSLKSLETNPQRLLWGGSNVPEYNRR